MELQNLPLAAPEPNAGEFIDILMGRSRSTRVPQVEYIVDDVVLRQQKISITPLHYDMTNEALLNHLGWVSEIVCTGGAKPRSRKKPKGSRKKA